jgi:hypothetical protein
VGYSSCEVSVVGGQAKDARGKDPTQSSSSKSSSKDDSLRSVVNHSGRTPLTTPSDGAIAGIVIAAIVLFILIIVLVVFAYRHHKNTTGSWTRDPTMYSPDRSKVAPSPPPYSDEEQGHIQITRARYGQQTARLKDESHL